VKPHKWTFFARHLVCGGLLGSRSSASSRQSKAHAATQEGDNCPREIWVVMMTDAAPGISEMRNGLVERPFVDS